VPGLGLKRGLAEDLVIAPYATVMALMVAPRRACENLQRLAAEAARATTGFTRPSITRPRACLRTRPAPRSDPFMAHHQGMSLLALLNVLHDHPMQRRFMACPRCSRPPTCCCRNACPKPPERFTEALGIDATRDLQTESEA
jgi:cyclic beta-1,2-glucan synthetase